MFEEHMLRSLHVQAMRAADLHAEREPHVLFQASTIAALLDGDYDGDVSFAQLAEHGDTGLGTLNGLDGEMIALDGRFLRADAAGRVHPIPPDAMTPFAAVTWFDPVHRIELPEPADLHGLCCAIDALVPEGVSACAVRVDGEFESVTARSVPAQSKPYRPLTEVVAEQSVFEIGPAEGTLVGFRFPTWAEGLEVAGHHLHFVDGDRRRGGHVLALRMLRGTLLVDDSDDLHVELPGGVALDSGEVARDTHAAIEMVERA